MITTRYALPIALFTAGSLLAACSDNVVTPPGVDSGTPDTPPADNAPVDRPPVDRPEPPPPTACPTTDDLSTMTPGSDGAVRVRGANTDSDLNRFGAFDATCFSGGAVGKLMVYSYTMRADGALRASTVNPGTTSAGFDTFVAVLGACISTGRAIACNDNTTDPAAGTAHARHSTATTGFLAQGQHVYVVVGGRGNTAAAAQSGAFELSVRELAAGAAEGPCRLSGDACGAGLLCTSLSPVPENQGVCKRPVATGMPCVGGDLCARGSSCVANAGDTAHGTCRMDGTNGAVCVVGTTGCGAGLSCTNPIPTPDATGLCRPTLMGGAECDPAQIVGVCGGGTTCRQAPNAMNPGRYQCFAPGARGGVCRAMEPRCDTGLACATSSTLTCRETVMRGAECDLTGNATACETGTSCAPDAVFAGGTCAPDGTAAGATCRDAMPGCDAGLTCSAVGARNVCHRDAAPMAPCDWRYGSVSCAAGATCLAGGPSRGVCASPASEAEPNGTPATAQGPVTESAIFHAAITAGDIDCFGVRVPMDASLFVETNDNAGGCPAGGADTVVDVYNAAGARLAENDDIASNQLCSRISGLSSGPLNRMPAGVYAVCVRSYSATAAIASYYLTIALVPLTN